MLLLLILNIVKNYDSDNEGYGTYSTSPATLKLSKGHALMMIYWPDATMKISIPNEFSRTVTVTPKNGYSLFTFKDPATITITFSSKISYFVSSCPQANSKSGAWQYFTNGGSYTSDMTSVKKDLYFSIAQPYKITGSFSTGMFGATLTYYPGTSSPQTRTSLTNLVLSPLQFTTSLVRASNNAINYNVEYTSSHAYNPTVSTFVLLDWSEVPKNQNNYLSNGAYGGSSLDGTANTILISRIGTGYFSTSGFKESNNQLVKITNTSCITLQTSDDSAVTKRKQRNAWIIAGSVCGVVAVAAIIVAVTIYIKKHKKNENDVEDRDPLLKEENAYTN